LATCDKEDDECGAYGDCGDKLEEKFLLKEGCGANFGFCTSRTGNVNKIQTRKNYLEIFQRNRKTFSHFGLLNKYDL